MVLLVIGAGIFLGCQAPTPTPTPMPTATPFPTPTPDPRIEELVGEVHKMNNTLTLLLTPQPSPTPDPRIDAFDSRLRNITKLAIEMDSRVLVLEVRPTPTPLPTIKQAYDIVRKSVVRIESKGKAGSSQGTGWAIEESLLVTDYHVVADAVQDPQTQLTVYVPTTDGEQPYSAKIVGWDRLRDVALLQTDTKLMPLKTLGIYTSEVPVQALAIGWSGGVQGFPSVKVGVITTMYVFPSLSNIRVFQSDAAFDPGDSGGPVVDLQGRVLGVIQASVTQSGGKRVLGEQLALEIRSFLEVYPDMRAGKMLNESRQYWFVEAGF
ncbi:MAG: trypsin-like peptidase domain-containing protein [Chloroflexi bacterium]|nr:trypsin-like peptidase domain-containing protein [Chloroflexota bacterium]